MTIREQINNNAYDSAIRENGHTVVNGVKYAIGQQPYLDSHGSGAAYRSYGFTREMMAADGSHDPLFDECVNLVWDASDWANDPHSADEFDCDWENDAILG